MIGRSYASRWREAVEARLASQVPIPGPVLTEADLAGLPDPVRRYVSASGALGRPVPVNLRVEFAAVMYRRPGDTGMKARSVQVNWFDRPTRLFTMTARMFGLPVRALHLYRDEEATFQVRVGGLKTMVDQSGEIISGIETVTLLNDLCVFAPGTLADPRLEWHPVDDRTVGVTFHNGRRVVDATLFFNDRDELVDFASEDRPELDGERVVAPRWRTPMSDHRTVAGMHLPHHALAVYDRPDGPFTYGEFDLVSVRYDVTSAE
jgi:hypothetical protein